MSSNNSKLFNDFQYDPQDEILWIVFIALWVIGFFIAVFGNLQ